MSEESKEVYKYQVLSGLFERKKLLKIKQKIKTGYFKDAAESQLFKFCIDFFRDTRAVPTKEVVIDAYKDKYVDLREETYFILDKLNYEIDDALFEHSMSEFLKSYELELLSQARKTLHNPHELGVNRAVNELSDIIYKIKSVKNSEFQIHHTNDANENTEFFDKVLNKEESSQGFPTSNPELNKLTGGMAYKKLWIVAGAPGEMKSTQLLNWTYDGLMAKANIFFCTVEMSKDRILENLLALHIFRKYDYVLDTQKLRPNTKYEYTDEEKRLIMESKSDWEQMKTGLTVFELPSKNSLGNLEAKLLEEHQNKPVDLLFIDYLMLLKPEHRRKQKFEEGEELFQSAKALANGFADGRGLFVCTAHQINTEGIKRAHKRGHYEFEDFASTPEARNSPDLAISNWMGEDLRRQNELKQRIHKNRDGMLPQEPWIAPVVFECGAINPCMQFDDEIPTEIKLDED